MQSIHMAVSVVLPMAMLMGLGVLLRLWGIADASTMKKVDKIIFSLFIPALVFDSIYHTDFRVFSDPVYLIYGAAGLTAVFLPALLLVPRLIADPASAAAFGQGIVRPNYAIFGAAIAQGIYGEDGTGIVMLMGAMSIPLTNIMSAVILEKGRDGRASGKKLFLAAAKNPIVLSVVLALAVKSAGIQLPVILDGVVEDIAGLATPVSFLSIGVSLGFGRSTKKGLLALATALRLVILPLIFVSGAAALGLRNQELVSVLILFGAPTAVSSYPMAVAMGADTDLAGQQVAVSTLLSLITMFFWTASLDYLCLI